MHSSIRRALAASAAVGLALLGVSLTASPAAAAGCVVDTTADAAVPTNGMLRYALQTISCPVITFSSLFDTPQTINLDNTSLVIDESVTIQGPGVENLTIQRANSGSFYALFFVVANPTPATPIDVTINDLTMDKDATDSGFVLGVGLYALNSALLRDLNLTNVVIQNQDSNGDGGAIIVETMTGAADFDNLTLRDNTAASNGGGFWLDGASSVTLANSLIDGNTALDSTAGGAYITDVSGLVSITNTTFSDNTASPGDSSGHAGALRFTDVGDVDIIGSNFIHNIATDSGGAIGLGMTQGYGEVTISDSTFVDNEAQAGYGGAIFTDGSVADPFTISRTSFLNNSATSTDPDGALGGAIYVNEADEGFTIDSSTFSGNSTNGFGVSVAVDSITGGELALFFIVNSTFDEDLTAASGDRMIFVESNQGTFAIAYSTLVGYQPVYVADPEPGVSTVTSTIVQSGAGQSDLDNEDDPFQVQYSILSKAHEPLNVTDLGNNQFSTDAQLGPLQNNGGPTDTRMPASNGPAVGKGGPTLGAPEWDQRAEGFPRVDGVLDVGAVEIPAALPATGPTIPLWIPIAGGIVLLLGLGAIAYTVIARRKVG